MPGLISKVEYQDFWNDGFLALPRISKPSEVSWMTESYDRMFAEPKGEIFDFGSSDTPEAARAPVLQILNPSKYHSEFRHTVFRQNAHSIAQALLGPTAEFVFEHAMMKPAGNGGVTPWHQDKAFYAKYTDYSSITFWMPLQDVDNINGCLTFIPGSHKGPLLPHRPVGGDPAVHGLEAVGVDATKSLPVFVAAGGVSIHHNMTLHGAGPNPSDQPRRAYALGFAVRDPGKYMIREEFPWNAAHNAWKAEHMTLGERALSRAKGFAKALRAGTR